ncbi:MAG TPA: alpha/beta hydrolase [Gammaproteobacteria bacterium]|nr:alpha/beta hydrolase [Gammaproteobacteria bacterium]
MLMESQRARRAASKGALSGIVASLALAGCTYLHQPMGPIPTQQFAALQPAPTRTLVIVLPGRADDLEDMGRSGIVASIQSGWPGADVVLAGLTIGYYADGRMTERLHDEVVAVAHARGYLRIWIAGASMGGMGALLYERRYPQDVTGLVLMAPFMGSPSLVRSVADAGGVAAWDPGPVPAEVDADNYPNEMWRVVKSWAQDPVQAERIWLVCGDEDRLLPASKLIAPLLPKEHFIQPRGGHDWDVWDAGARQAFAGIAASPP